MTKKHPKLDYYCTVTEGQIKAKDPTLKDKMKKFVEANEGQDIYVCLDVVRDAVSLAQHRFFHGVLLPALCDATGETDKYRMKDFCKGMFLVDVVEVAGEPAPVVPSLTQISKDEMALFIDKCLQLLADSGGVIDGNEIDKYETVIREATHQMTLFEEE